MDIHQVRTIIKRLWVWGLITTLVVWIYPVEYQITRILFVGSLLATIGGGTFVWWQHKWTRILFLAPVCLALALLSLPERDVNPKELATDYAHSLKWYRGTKYVWGGENLIGIDCSGLVRKGLFWGKIRNGIRTLNGRPIRGAMQLWWYDSSAEALLNGHRGWTSQLFTERSISTADHTKLQIGDIAVTADGVHALAYLGNEIWIEADPDHHKVIEEKLPTDNTWFGRPVVFLRWEWLMNEEP